MFQKLASPFRTFGLVAGTVYAINRVLVRISPSASLAVHDWMVQPITSKPLLPKRLASAYTARFIEDDQALVAAMPIRPEVRASRRAQGTRCLGTFRKGSLVGYVWFAFDQYEEDEARCTFKLRPAEQSIFDFDFYVMPEYRGGLAFAAIWNGASQLLHERGVRYSFSRLDYFNRASAKAHDHLGWRRVGRALILRLWTMELILATRSPRVFLSLNTHSRATYLLTPEALEADVEGTAGADSAQEPRA